MEKSGCANLRPPGPFLDPQRYVMALTSMDKLQINYCKCVKVFEKEKSHFGAETGGGQAFEKGTRQSRSTIDAKKT